MVIIFFDKPILKNILELLQKIDKGIFFPQDFQISEIKLLTWLEYQGYIKSCEYNFYVLTTDGKQKMQQVKKILGES